MIECGKNEYQLGTVPFKEAVKVFAFANKAGILPMITKNQINFAFLADDDFADIEQILNKHTLFDNRQISKISNHWDTNRADYTDFVINIIIETIKPFLEGNTKSAQQEKAADKT